MDNYEILRSGPGVSFAETLLSLRIQLENYLGMEASEGRRAVFVRFFLSDAQNQAGALRAMLKSFSWTGRKGEQDLEDIPAISIVEQPPLDRSGIAVLVHTSSEKRKYLFHSLRLREDEAQGLDSYAQARLLFDKYLSIIRPLGLDLKTHCVLDQLLREGGSSLEKVPYLIIYLRDIADYTLVDAYIQRRFQYLPRVILEARVCRPSWLIEMECEVR